MQKGRDVAQRGMGACESEVLLYLTSRVELAHIELQRTCSGDRRAPEDHRSTEGGRVQMSSEVTGPSRHASAHLLHGDDRVQLVKHLKRQGAAGAGRQLLEVRLDCILRERGLGFRARSVASGIDIGCGHLDDTQWMIVLRTSEETAGFGRKRLAHQPADGGSCASFGECGRVCCPWKGC